MSPSEIMPWLFFSLLICVLLGLDLFVFNRKSHAITFREAVSWTITWIAIALAFNGYIYFTRGPSAAIDFFTGYVIEKSLSIDNLFVFLLVFKYFNTPKNLMHKVLFWGILGAVVMRALFIWLGIGVLIHFHWMVYIFGIILVYSGIKLLCGVKNEINPDSNPLIKLFSYCVPVIRDYREDKFFVKIDGRWHATLLFLVLLMIETADVIFAIDSIPAILAITLDPYIVYTSNIFAILGLRALYFVLSHMMGIFNYLHYALSFILVFIGAKMLLLDIYPIPSAVALAVVLVALLLAIIASKFKIGRLKYKK